MPDDMILSDTSRLAFCVTNDDGTFGAPKPIGAGVIELEPNDNIYDETCVPLNVMGEWHGTLSITDADVVRDIIGGGFARLTDRVDEICFERQVSVWRYRHDRVWQYRRERKGNKANRKTRGHWEWHDQLTFLSGTITEVSQGMSIGCEPAPVNIGFELRQECQMEGA